MKLKIKRLHPEAIIPKHAKPGDAGLDITAVSVEEHDLFLQYHSGLAFEIPEGYVGLLFGRSSISKMEQRLSNCVGVIDSSYRGELIIRMKGKEGKIYKVGDRIAQLVIVPYLSVETEEVEELAESHRGDGAFGSTGF